MFVNRTSFKRTKQLNLGEKSARRREEGRKERRKIDIELNLSSFGAPTFSFFKSKL